jgi:hypothetical protein
MKRLLALIAVLFSAVALAAEPVSVTVNFPAGLTAGKVPVTATGTGLLPDARISVAVDPGSGLEVQEVTLDKDNRGELELLGVSQAAIVTVKVHQAGRNYALTKFYGNQQTLTFTMDDERSRAALPSPLILWGLAMLVLGAMAIRGQQKAF